MTTQKKKQIRQFGETIDLMQTPVVNAIKELQQMLEAYGDKAFIDTYQYEYDVHEYPAVFYYREETDEEFEKRLEEEKQRTLTQEQKERILFEQLKKKYG